jgi:hypothetical protein
MVERLHMIPAHSLEEALAKAEKIIGKADAGITAIPDGVGVMVVENRPTKDYHKYKCGSKTVAP